MVFLASAQKINISPAIMRFDATPGEPVSQRLLILNNGDKSQILRLYVGDWFRDPNGGHVYLPVNSVKETCSSWISLSHDLIEVPAMNSVEVIVTLDAPAGYQSDSMKWAMVFLLGVVEKEDPLSPDNTLSTTIEESFQFGVHVYNTPENLTETSAKAIDMVPLESQNAIQLQVQNSGLTQLRGTAYLEFVNLETGEEFNSEEIEAPIFPGYSRHFNLPVPEKLPEGEYSVLGLFDYGDTFPLAGYETTYTHTKAIE